VFIKIPLNLLNLQHPVPQKRIFLVPTLCVGMHTQTLCVTPQRQYAERTPMDYHAERGNQSCIQRRNQLILSFLRSAWERIHRRSASRHRDSTQSVPLWITTRSVGTSHAYNVGTNSYSRSYALRGNAYTDALRHATETVRRAYPYGLPRGAWEPVNFIFSSVFSVVTIFYLLRSLPIALSSTTKPNAINKSGDPSPLCLFLF